MPVQPQRIQRSRQHKMLSPNGLPIVYVGRPTKWGNPFKVGDGCSRQEAVDRFATTYLAAANLDLEALKGKNLACWCPLDQPCHADVLLKLANRE